MTKIEFVRCLAVLESGMPSRPPLTKAQSGVWYECLKDLSEDAVRTAVLRYLMDGDDWPSIAKLRRLATEAAQGTLPESGDAWEAVRDAIRRFSAYNPDGARTWVIAHAGDLAWRGVEQIGGFEQLCEMTPDQRPTFAAQYRRAYESLASRAETQRRLPEAIRPRPAISHTAAALPRSDIPAVKLVADSLAVDGVDGEVA